MTAPAAPAAPWLLAHATACAEAVATALDLLEGDEVETVPDDAGTGFELRVEADPPRRIRALRWSVDGGWEATRDAAHRPSRRWSALALAADADPIALCEALRARR